jgi:hypothetical protein
MRRLLFTGIILCLFLSKSIAQVKTISNTKNIKKINDSTILVFDKAVTPKNQIFYFHDYGGKLVATYFPGHVVYKGILGTISEKIFGHPTPPKQSCFKVACPSGAPANSDCWDCKPAN